MFPLRLLHGAIAGVVLCAILFADEVGLPIPLAPSEVLLVLAGVLIESRGLPGWIFVPAAVVAMTAGMLGGYGWARIVGEHGLETLAQRVGGGKAYASATARLRAAGPLGIGVARLIPGVRPWATLLSGATGVELRRFLLGALPALLIWAAVWLSLGAIIGLPVAHFLGRFERLMFRGALLLVLGTLGCVGLHRLRREGIVSMRRRGLGLALALLIANGATASILAGVLALGRGVFHVRADRWLDAVLIVALLVADTAFIGARYRREIVHAGVE